MDADVDTSQTVGPDEVARRVGKLTDAAFALAAVTDALRPDTPTSPRSTAGSSPNWGWPSGASQVGGSWCRRCPSCPAGSAEGRLSGPAGQT